MTFKELKTIKDSIAAAYNIDTSAAARIVGYYNAGPGKDEETMQALLMGDLSSVPAAASALGLKFFPRKDQGDDEKGKNFSGSQQKNVMKISEGTAEKITAKDSGQGEKTTVKTARRSDTKKTECTQLPATDNAIETTQTDILPAGLYDDICATLENYCRQQNMDPSKIHPLQWKSACIYIGQGIKARGILRDYEREKNHGGVLYDGVKVSALLDIYDYICGQYKQVPFVYNFPRFAGISQNYFADYENRLTSSRVGLYKKALDIQKAGLIDAVNGGGSATVGNIFLSKALAGLQETVTIQHVSAASTPAAVALPVFGPDGGLLEEKRPE